MAKNYVCDGAKIECKLCTKPEGELKVTSNEIKVQDKIFATAKDKEKINLIFQGNCKKSPYQASACQAVIKTEDWKGTADLKIQDNEALLENSTIMCAYGGAPIKITDHLQVNNPGELQPVAAPVIAPIEEPIITIKWKDELYVDSKGMKKSNKEVEETSDKKAWLEATTLNILPGEEIEFEVDKEEQDKN
jgi:hypothetical protein